MAAFGFTPASDQDVFSLEIAPSSSETTSSSLSGPEARVFYENLTKNGEEKDPHVRQRNRGSSRRERRRAGTVRVQQSRTDSGPQRGTGESEASSQRSSMLKGLRLLRCANEGDIPGMKDLLSKGVDINFQDSFFWTAVMCASWSGQREAVRLLLQHGAAWVGVVDTQGRDAKDLAREAGHVEVLEELLNFGKRSRNKKPSESSALQPQWCEVCRSEYSGTLTSHLSSTLHQFSLRRPPPTPYYCLPPSSNSYRMMVHSGWRPGSGLGPEGEGTKQPVATVLKRDQEGLGYGQKKKARVTHFQPRDCDAVKQPSRAKEERLLRGQRKEESQRKELMDKNWERDFRTSFYL